MGYQRALSGFYPRQTNSCDALHTLTPSTLTLAATPYLSMPSSWSKSLFRGQNQFLNIHCFNNSHPWQPPH
jgi:hypothetical protein